MADMDIAINPLDPWAWVKERMPKHLAELRRRWVVRVGLALNPLARYCQKCRLGQIKSEMDTLLVYAELPENINLFTDIVLLEGQYVISKDANPIVINRLRDNCLIYVKIICDCQRENGVPEICLDHFYRDTKSIFYHIIPRGMVKELLYQS